MHKRENPVVRNELIDIRPKHALHVVGLQTEV